MIENENNVKESFKMNIYKRNYYDIVVDIRGFHPTYTFMTYLETHN